MSHDEHISHTSPSGVTNRVATFFERFIYAGRWVIAPMYVGLLIALILYTYRFALQMWEMVHHISTMTEADTMLSILSLIDGVMTGNLALMIMVGSYVIFIRPLKIGEHDKPGFLSGITSGSLKTKMGGSLVGISSIHLLRAFFGAETYSSELLIKLSAIHLIFVVSTIALAYTDKISHSHSNEQHS